MEFKRLTLAESAIIHQIAEQAFAYGAPWSQAQFGADLAEPLNAYFGAFVEEKCIGFIGVRGIFDLGEVTNICVLPEAQGKKIGQKLLGVGMAFLKKQGCTSVLLEVRESNEQARCFYQVLGFEVISERKLYYHAPVENGLVMSYKWLNEKEEV